MTFTPVFPTHLHQDIGELIRGYFSGIAQVDTILVVNSCARGHAVAESDLDFAILLQPDTHPAAKEKIETAWQRYIETHPQFLQYSRSGPSAHLHLDLITGQYSPGIMEDGGGVEYFEIEIGNQIRYSAPMGDPGAFFKALQNKWLPYYSEELQSSRLAMTRYACAYDLDHIPLYLHRGLYFQAFDRLYVAFQKFLQAVFIAKRTYPIAYNKWIRLQVEDWLKMPDLYSRLSPIISISNIESDEINEKAKMLREMLEGFA
jgi:hypothetical protein